MRELYKNIESELDKVKFNNLWPGFSRMEFAIYNKTKVFLNEEEIPYDERFLGNTSINYNGRNLAIFYVEDPNKEDIKELTSLVVHEMFHSYQISNNEVRFPNDLEGLNYPMYLKNFEIRYRENILLVEALTCNDKDIKYTLLQEILSLRMLRLQKYGEAVKYEFVLETIEGSAEYCGTKALKDISEKSYEKRMEYYKKILHDDIPMLFDIRKNSYYTGTLFLFLLEELDISFTREIQGQNQYIFDEIADKVQYKIINANDIEESQIKRYFIEYRNERDKRFEDFFNKPFIKQEGNFHICGYDPMNMIKRNNEILCTHFIMLIDKVHQKQIFLEGPVVVKLHQGTSNQVIEYYS